MNPYGRPESAKTNFHNGNQLETQAESRLLLSKILATYGFLTNVNPSITIGSRMGRIRQTIKVDGQECWTLFDTGAQNTYVIPTVAQILQTSTMPRPFRTALEGEVRETNTAAILEVRIQDHPISTHALVIDEIRKDEDGTAIEILFGALAMQQWGIRPVPDEERLDMSRYPEEFVEF